MWNNLFLTISKVTELMSTFPPQTPFMDESAHDWKYVRLGRELGWSGVALKTCKTQTEPCFHSAGQRMDLMVQDLTNPMLAQIPHVLLGAHAGTIMGVESNGMQFYPEASIREAKVHPGIYNRRNGMLIFAHCKPRFWLSHERNVKYFIENFSLRIRHCL